jgi:hypothetical protein
MEKFAGKICAHRKEKKCANCNLHENRNHIVQFARSFGFVNCEFTGSTRGIGFAQINSADARQCRLIEI